MKSLIRDIKKAVDTVGGVKLVTLLDIILCGIVFGASPNNYINFDFRHASIKERRTFLTHRKNEYLMRIFNQKESVWQMQNKFEFARIIGNEYGRNFARTDIITREDFIRIARRKQIIYKPLNGGQGVGIKVFTPDDYKDIERFIDYLHTLPTGILEEWIEQHTSLTKLYPDAVNPIRITETSKITLIETGQIHCLIVAFIPWMVA